MKKVSFPTPNDKIKAKKNIVRKKTPYVNRKSKSLFTKCKNSYNSYEENISHVPSNSGEFSMVEGFEYISPTRSEKTDMGNIERILKRQKLMEPKFDLKNFLEEYDNEDLTDDSYYNSSVVEELSVESGLKSNYSYEECKLDSSKEQSCDSQPNATEFSFDEVTNSNDSTDVEFNFACDTSADDFQEFPKSRLLLLNEGACVQIHGMCSIEVLHGEVDIFGHRLNSSSDAVNVYSFRSSSLLVIENKTVATKGDILVKNLVSYCMDEIGNKVVPKGGALLHYSAINSIVNISFLNRYISQQILPNRINPCVEFNPKGSWNSIHVSEDWDSVITKMDSSSKLMICGGKGVGKSTFLRYSINRLLEKYEKVNVIDLDPGQSEFTVAGSISIIAIDEPLLGPNFSHLKKPIRSILTNIMVGQDPDEYLKAVKALMTHLHELKEYPTVINYMGYTPGMGINIVSCAINYVKPTTVLQINSTNRKKNFFCDLTKKNVIENSKLLRRNITFDFDFELIKVLSKSDDLDGWQLEARQMREMCILSYLGQVMSSSVRSILSEKLPIYEIGLDAIKITNFSGEEQSPAVANANFVALCSLEKYSSFTRFNCHGWGIVRAVNIKDNKLYLITPESGEILEERVHYLVVGCTTLPPSLYMTSDDILGKFPYVVEGELTSFGQISKRTHLPAKRNKQ